MLTNPFHFSFRVQYIHNLMEELEVLRFRSKELSDRVYPVATQPWPTIKVNLGCITNHRDKSKCSQLLVVAMGLAL